MKVIEKLIISPLSKREISDLMGVGLARTLLYLNDNYNSPNFAQIRMSSLISITVVCPEKIVPFLCQVFYEDNHTVSERIDVLETLCGAAKELSSVVQHSESRLKIGPSRSFDQHTKSQQERLKLINERVEKTTKRWGIVSLQKEIERKNIREDSPIRENRFSQLVGLFF